VAEETNDVYYKRSQSVGISLGRRRNNLDSSKFAFDTTNYVLRMLGKRAFTPQEFRELFLSDWRVHIKHMGINSEDEVRFLVDTWNTRLVIDRYKFKLYDGILSILRYLHLRSCKMALVSSSSRFQLQLYFNMFAVNEFFSTVIAKEDADEQKPSAKPIIKAAEQLKVSPNKCVLIYDAEDGIKAAQKLGATTIGVTWGFNSSQRITDAKPDFIAETPKELYRVITGKLGC
jgi:HAD superfamily hydrolase (TIGR01509 family)